MNQAKRIIPLWIATALLILSLLSGNSPYDSRKANSLDLNSELLRHLYYEMLRIRLVQLRIEGHYLENEMRTPIHLYIGQEAVAVGVCANLRREDYINSSHRSHGHYLAKGGNLKALVAELYCKETGCSRGRGGSMHLVDVSVGHYGSTSIVGGGIPIGTGMGLAIKMKKQSLVSVIFFGDGAADEGVFYESVNFAILKKLPVIFVLENNQYSVCSHVSSRQASDNPFHAMPGELLLHRKADGNDVVEVYRSAREAVQRARMDLGPSFIEYVTYRVRGHAGVPSQDAQGYRTCEEVKNWEARCPIKSMEQELLETGVITPAEIDAMQKRIENELDDAFAAARNDRFPPKEDLHHYLFCEPK